ncbi:MAG: peptidylprolyl isomerase [Gemmataceae bacterium]
MRGMLQLRGALLGMAISGMAAFAQTTPTTPTTPARPTAPAATAALPPASTVSSTTVAATVNGEAIYEQAVQRALERVPPARRTEERPRLVNYLVDNLLIDQSLRAAGYKVEDAEVDKRINDMKAELKKVGKEFDKMLGELQVSEKELRHHISADLRWYKYASAQATDKVLQEMFASSKDMFDGTAVRARHILLSADGKNDANVVAQLRALKAVIEKETETAAAKTPAASDKLAQEKARGTALVEVFSKYAREKSECPTKNTGGDVGWFQKAGFVVAPFSQAAFALQPFQMTDVVKTPFGYHLILVTERKPGKEVKFEDVKEVVKEVYFDRLHDGLAAQLRQRATISFPAGSK